MNDTLTSLQITAKKGSSPSQHSLSNPGSSYLHHNDVIIGEVMNDVIVDMKQLYQQCEHSKDEVKVCVEPNKDAIENIDHVVNENSDVVNRNSDHETTSEDDVEKDNELVKQDYHVANKGNDGLVYETLKNHTDSVTENSHIGIEIEIKDNVNTDETQVTEVTTA